MGAKPGELVRERNPNWRGGRSMSTGGYVLARVGRAHPLSDHRGYAYEHRVVASEMLGRPLRRDEIVHHKDGNKQNNARENLEVLDLAEHNSRHAKRTDIRRPGEPNPTILCACGCQRTLLRFDRSNRPRRFIYSHSKLNKKKSTT